LLDKTYPQIAGRNSPVVINSPVITNGFLREILIYATGEYAIQEHTLDHNTFCHFRRSGGLSILRPQRAGIYHA
jgi:hypothetical protein